MLPYSMLDLSPIPEGSDARDALASTLDLARHAEDLGFTRYWLAEHHNMPGIASAATAIVIGQVANATKRIRVGAGGIMLPNHAPLVVAEQFGTLATFFPGRIDLGLGRAPGTDMGTARALRRTLQASDDFPADVEELIGYLSPAQPGAQVRAIPGEGTEVPVWILGSSLYGAQLAAHFGLPYAFASHFAPQALDQAVTLYRSRFQPSRHLERPHFMLAVNAFAGEDDAEGLYLRSSMQQAFANLRSGRPGPLPRPVGNIHAVLDPQMLAMVEMALSCSVTGGPETIRSQLASLIERYQPDEIMFNGNIHDPAARKASFTRTVAALKDVTGAMAPQVAG